ncbi:MAG: nicotinic acid mononucleotide adenylyltransferase [Rhodospirillaceae bacterium]|nr:nicotinic acid mononucleotide adenylyltransferase [Rhodospirillaceae bacterium]
MRRPARRIGILGGSFNPAHDGHRHISLEALKRLRLDEVWWLVSPQNPLKPQEGMAPFEDRIEKAKSVADHPRIRVTDIEKGFGTTYTAETLARLCRRFPTQRFVWLMGADNLSQISRWSRWTRIFHTVPVAVFDRPSYSLGALSGRAARRFHRERIKESRAGRLADMRPPAWVFLHTPLNATSATALRARGLFRRSGG